MSDAVRPRRRWYALSGFLLIGSLGLGSLLFWFVVEPLVETGIGSPLRIVFAFVVLVAVVAAGFLAAFLAALIVAGRRARCKRDLAGQPTTPSADAEEQDDPR